jgi:lysophospholipase L1-like esterase
MVTSLIRNANEASILAQRCMQMLLLSTVWLFFASSTAFTQQLNPVNVNGPSAKSTVDIVYIGDSITQGVLLQDPGVQSPPAICTRLLGESLPEANIFMSNQGRSGHTTVDVLPATDTDFPAIEQAATQLQSLHPGRLVFSIMLGTNDSAESGPNGAPVSAEQYRDNLRAIISGLLRNFPASVVILHEPTWYSPNTHNRSDYGAAGLARLQTYFPMIDSLVRSFSSASDRVYQGDTSAFGFFAAHYRFDLVPEKGAGGTFYLHPNQQGADALAEFWFKAILHVILLAEPNQ